MSTEDSIEYDAKAQEYRARHPEIEEEEESDEIKPLSEARCKKILADYGHLKKIKGW